ncbi:NAD(P)/FAD-dependent oxidoreductase [Leucobacter sp. USHLN153]|uniref:NAD(P)/FAD-dependent oxidoreductase n=1 Tax=Leucobacter sp. USHLN153 TaxID=3081268 RepID=UPI0030173B39
MNNQHWDAIIIGGGAAGLNAAQTLGRSLRRTLVIDGGSPRNRFAGHMHNVLALDGTPPHVLLERGRAEAAAYGVEFREAEVRGVRDTETGAGTDGSANNTLTVELDTDESLTARTLIVATGVTDALPPIPGLAERWGTTVLHCPYCHGWEVRGQRIGVLTTSPLGAHQAKLLTQWTSDLTVFTAGLDGDPLAGSGALDPETERALRARGVKIVDEPVTEIVGEGSEIDAVRTAVADHPIDAIFTAGELVPRDNFLAGLDLDRAESPVGSFLAVDPSGRTSHPRIWAAGNVVNPGATVPVAMGAGVMAGAMANFALVEEDLA